MRELTLSELERLQALGAENSVPLAMTEDAFRAFYDRTARPLWAYLSRLTGDRTLADDLLQDTYYRFLLAKAAGFESEAHARNYLFRIATNLARDTRRRQITRPEQQLDENGVNFRLKAEATSFLSPSSAAAEERTDLRRAWVRLKPRERALLWLAYAQGTSHHDIGDTLGLKPSSIKMLLFRARRRLAGLLRGGEREGGRREQA